MNSSYLGIFDNWKDVQSEFQMNEPEPSWVYASYDIDGYEGSAIVAYKRGRDQYFVVEGSHCSCYGLEGQWDPTEYKGKAEFVSCLSKRLGGWHSSEFKEILEAVK